MMVQPERPQMSNDTPNFPKRPIKNYVPFENPNPKCSEYLCPNFCTPICNLCEFHCDKIHKGIHNKIEDPEIQKLIEKYRSENK